MGGSRMGFDLFSKQGWSNLLFAMSHKNYGISVRMIAADTFKQVWCWIVGHDEYDSGDCKHGAWYDLACRRCCHYIGKRP